MKDKIIFNMASIPQRVSSLKEVVLSILPQCDELHIYLNEWDVIPDFLYHPKITYYLSEEHLGDLGDVGKFFNVENEQGYIFTVDDDLIYPLTYARDMIAAIEQFNRQAVVTAHGRVLHAYRPSKSLYHDYKKAYNCTKDCDEGFVHIPGTGVTAFHTDTVIPPLEIFEAINMADVWLALYLQEKQIPVFVPSHRANWIQESKHNNIAYSIWASCHGRDEYQTSKINSIENWKNFTCDGKEDPAGDNSL